MRWLADNVVLKVSTHSRPKAAGSADFGSEARRVVSTHSRPKAAGYQMWRVENYKTVSTHSRPKAAGSGVKFKSIVS